MNKQKVLVCICIVIFMTGLAGSLWLLLTPHGTQVNIVQDGIVIYTFNLSVTEDQMLEIEYEGRINTVQIEGGRIRMLEADCPDKICVHMDWLSSGAMPIVCLPNHLVIEYAVSDDNHLDAVIR